MRSIFGFDGPLNGRGYAVRSAVGFLAPYAAAALIPNSSARVAGWMWMHPLGVLTLAAARSPALLALSTVFCLLSSWILAAAAVRRARTTGHGAEFAILVLVPLVQVAAIAWLALASRKASSEPLAVARERGLAGAQAAVLVGMGLCVAATILSTLVLGRYGYGLFAASPLVIGAATGFLANRREDLGAYRTAGLVTLTFVAGALVLISFALEGGVCLLMAAPLIISVGWLGAMIGRAIARSRHNRRWTLMSFGIAPALMIVDVALPPQTAFESVESVEIAANPSDVWNSLVHMGPIPDAPAAPFRWGLAYPLRGEFHGQGVDAVREGVFSTGIAYERVTVWEPGHRLEFIVLSDPPTMQELSPYDHVFAPHTQGYFRTIDARFAITPVVPGRVLLTLTTRHALDIDPAMYWLPMAQWAVHSNKVRVLQHFRRQAEGTEG